MTASASELSSTTLLSISAVRRRKPSQPRQRDSRGDRYVLSGAYQPGVGLARGPQAFAVGTPLDQPTKQTVVSRNTDSATIAVADPYEPGKRIRATVNRRVDLLEDERSHGRITVSQYEIGRQVQAVFERASGAHIAVDDAQTGGRVVDPSKRPLVRDAAMIRAVDNAREVKALMMRIERGVGPVGARMLRELLSGAGTFKDYARTRDPLASERKAAQIADRFRFLLEALDETFAATGIAVKDAEGNPMIYAETGEATGEEFDERGRLVRAGRGYRWGRQVNDPMGD